MITVRHMWLGIGGNPRKALDLPDEPFTHIVIDSRQAQPGACFIALPGEHRDGHEFVGDALARGARAALVHRVPPNVSATVLPVEEDVPGPVQEPVLFLVEDTLAALQRAAAYWRALHTPRVVGITGSVGKTSTKEMTAAVLRQRFVTLWNRASYNNEIGLPLTLLHLGSEHQALVVEMGAYEPGDITALCRLAHPHVGVVTNVGVSHLERMGTVDRIWEAKSELVRSLPPDGVAVLNWDDERVREMAHVTPARVFSYGLTPEADVWAEEVETLGLEGIRFTLHYGDDVVPVRLPWLGEHMVHTALAATAVGLVFGMEWEEILAGLGDPNAELRIVVIPGLRGSHIIDDTYNASPASMLAALNLLADLDGSHMAILGDMLELGHYEEIGHRKVGARAAKVVDRLIAVGERARWIAEEAVAAGLDPERVVHVRDVEEAIAQAREWIRPGDFVLVKASRAMALERVVDALREEGQQSLG
ncbi:MAG: UDP-N-acetylmuramoyl-tripeptide--D-alanyl-D-alanine ligase [Chloroflexi bacterium]|nr:UDP-N-acetylmuramoyl-tripeptide--D-alanyl-D-alanine ligase [Chloroflexota bacterium]